MPPRSFRIRTEYPGAVHHVTIHGAPWLCPDDADRDVLVATLAQTVPRVGWAVLAFAALGTHAHLLVKTPEPTLSRGMGLLNGTYAKRYNAGRGHAGHVLSGRFRACLVEEEGHLRSCLRYVPLNPVGAGLVERPDAWRWSTFAATAGREAAPRWLDADAVLGLFGDDPDGAREAYTTFVLDGLADSDGGDRLPLRWILDGSPRGLRLAVAVGYTQDEIGRALGVSQSTIARRLQRG